MDMLLILILGPAAAVLGCLLVLWLAWEILKALGRGLLRLLGFRVETP